MAVLKSPSFSASNARKPIAILPCPDVILFPAAAPIQIVPSASAVALAFREAQPIATARSTFVDVAPALLPMNVFFIPVVMEKPALYPNAVLAPSPLIPF